MACLGPGCEYVRSPSALGFPSHAPRRTLKMAIRNPRTGEDEYPMFGFAAAPEIVTALRCCHASLPPFTKLSVVLMMDSGRSTSNSRSGEPSRALDGIACGFASCSGVGDAFNLPVPG